MATEALIDFSTYSNKELEASLVSIKRASYEKNFQACLAEIEKRKANGSWVASKEKEERESLLKARKWARIFALIQSIGGLVGIGSFAITYGPSFFNGISFSLAILVLVILSVFATTAWVGWKYWRAEEDTGAWRILLVMQIPGFNISSLVYQFYSGFQLPIGFVSERYKMGANFGSTFTLSWNPQNTGTSFVINFAPVIALVLLSMAQRQTLER